MTLFKQWDKLINGQTEETFEKFWEKYSQTETKLYKALLSKPSENFSGVVGDLVKEYEADPVIFVGFLDGIQSSLNNPFDLSDVDEESSIDLDVDLEKLFYNMIVAEADYLYGLEEWDDIFTQEKRQEIYDTFRRSRTVVKEKEPGRNDPCPCGSGKKYKKCCGANK